MTHPCVGTEGAGNHLVHPPHQQVAVWGVCRDGQLDSGEVTPTAQLTSAVGHAYAATLAPRQVCGTA